MYIYIYIYIHIFEKHICELEVQNIEIQRPKVTTTFNIRRITDTRVVPRSRFFPRSPGLGLLDTVSFQNVMFVFAA